MRKRVEVSAADGGGLGQRGWRSKKNREEVPHTKPKSSF